MRGTSLITIAAGTVLLLSTVTIATAGFDLPPGGALVRSSDTSQPVVMGDSFTYQGRLTEGGGPASGVYDLRFILYDAESGGTQVGSTVAVNDVAVAAGLFTVSLDFGTGVWNGDARWMEIAVRPGASSGTYTVLSPRQAVGSTPYALYAKAAGGIAVPFSANGSIDGPDELFGIEQTGSGIGLKVDRGYTGATPYPAIYGVNSGTGGAAGVQGETLNSGGVGVAGYGANSGSTAGRFIGWDEDSVALEFGNGALKASGSPSPAFVWEVDTSGNTCNSDKVTVIDNALANANESAVLLVTPYDASPATLASVPGPISVAYNYTAGGCSGGASKWVIFNEAAAFTDGQKFHVLVIDLD
ncbi:MAG: hypothetical protein HS107_11515 [Thermoflexaceae bacterium]|nr:hypothetical protein [Thermoflexaceae bacterium]